MAFGSTDAWDIRIVWAGLDCSYHVAKAFQVFADISLCGLEGDDLYGIYISFVSCVCKTLCLSCVSTKLNPTLRGSNLEFCETKLTCEVLLSESPWKWKVKNGGINTVA